MGYGPTTNLTAIGDVVNVASRLENTSKELGVQLVVSQDVAARGGVDLAAFPVREVELPGGADSMTVHSIESLVLPGCRPRVTTDNTRDFRGIGGIAQVSASRLAASRSRRSRWRRSVRRAALANTAAKTPSPVPPAIRNMIRIW